MRAGYVFLIILTITLAGCSSASYGTTIQLSALRPLPEQSPNVVIPLRISVAAVISPKGTAESYQPLLDYLSARLGRPVELVQRRTYAETNDLVESGYVDMAFVCTSAYIAGHDKFNMELLAAPQVNAAAVYYSLLIVPAYSSVQNIADLRGKAFAFTDPMSNSGRVYPTYLVQQMGSTPDRFFMRTFYTYNHDDAIRAVAEGLADGAAVDSLVYDFAIARDPELARQVRVIQRSPAFGIPPVVVSPKARPQLKATLQNLLLAMAYDPAGVAALQALGVERFVRIDDTAYDSVRQLIKITRLSSP
jgi:phosphonate transport system substrate-binding protein